MGMKIEFSIKWNAFLIDYLNMLQLSNILLVYNTSTAVKINDFANLIMYDDIYLFK